MPQTGTPKAIAVLLHGYQEALLSGIIVKTSTARTLAENLPAAYNLLPSEKYFYDVATPLWNFLMRQRQAMASMPHTEDP